jgi:hypothetical protein
MMTNAQIKRVLLFMPSRLNRSISAMTISVSWIIAKGIRKGSMFVIVFSSSESGVVVIKYFPSSVFSLISNYTALS